ncbi:MAG: hypothetical protein KDB00_22935 [Planctomycetales bacterium]|nr:hypothetical protein [Planctomycetales bacterium]
MGYPIALLKASISPHNSRSTIVLRLRQLSFANNFCVIVASAFAAAAVMPTIALAASPESIAVGQQLFEQDWSPQNPELTGKDGLGPLFNGRSCVVCHNQGGTGGGGSAEFNALTVGIHEMHVVAKNLTEDVVEQAVCGFHPGFIDPKSGLVNSFALSHRGGSSAMEYSREKFRGQTAAVFSETGGPVSAAEVRLANATPILYQSNNGGVQTTINARLFQRNTTALFGAGLIDLVTTKQLRDIERAQKSHPEISGRLATLSGGDVGKFGWRGDVKDLLHFCERACAGELGLQSRRLKQPVDPTNSQYRNPSHDVTDAQLKSIAAFIASLPTPVRQLPSDSDRRQLASHGESLFASIGCAVCHQPNMGPAVGVYSDLLLHDMGKNLYDLNPADPYISRLTPVSQYDLRKVSEMELTTGFSGQGSTGNARYGGQSSMAFGSASGSFPTRGFRAFPVNHFPSPHQEGVSLMPGKFRFIAPTSPLSLMQIVSLGEETLNLENLNVKLSSGDSSKNTKIVESKRLRIHIEPTRFNQEWRTPPLWGVNDSAPYMHDGRAETLLEAITMHEGESKGTRDRFMQLSLQDRKAIIEFLQTLVAPPNAPQPKS